MSVSQNLLLFIVGVGILQGIFLAALIYFHPKSDHSVNKYLILYILSYCVPMTTPIVQHLFSWQLLFLIDPFLLLIGPLLYFYVSSYKGEVKLKKAWPHLILFFVFLMLDIFLFSIFSSKYPLSSDVPPEAPHHPIVMIRVPLRIGQMFVYFFLTRTALRSYQRSIEHMYSEISRINLHWVRWLINGYLLLLLLMVGFYFVILKTPQYFGLVILINTAFVTPYLYAITFRGLTQPTLWRVKEGLTKEHVQEEIIEAEKIESKTGAESTRESKNQLSDDRKNEILPRVVALMEKDQLFLQSELTLQDLADKLETPSYQVTQAINEGLKKNFYDLVNGYRVQEAKRMLLDRENNNKILTVGLESGFNSKTTFNTVFKKFTGQTPSEYKDQHRSQLIQA